MSTFIRSVILPKMPGVEVFPLVLNIVTARVCNLNGTVAYEDAIAAALVGLSESHHRYDPKSKTKLTTFAYRRLVGSVNDYIARELTYANRYSIEDVTSRIETNQSQPSFEAELGVYLLFEKVIQVMETRLPGHLAMVLVRTYLEDADDLAIARELRVRPTQVAKLREAALLEVRRHLPGRIIY